MIYQVNIDYKSFSFTDPADAVEFAENALYHADDSVIVTIKLIKATKERAKECTSLS